MIGGRDSCDGGGITTTVIMVTINSYGCDDEVC